ncbi:period circadian protein isoform X1 [Rhopalosiphum padi]|uniref:period circadian protein isoform X1 n=2 Tax=Rhopalosiphum padi TaxID=40932 RepID=UPI00298E6939|nr:period circadian protein isoform X1 [Rhopalosiphum padi]
MTLSSLPDRTKMEGSQSFSVNQTRTDYDSGYSCTSSQSKSSDKSRHPGLSTESSFEEQNSTLLTTDKNGEMSTLNSKPAEQSNQTILRGLNTINNQNPSDNCSKSKQKNSKAFKPQTNQLFNVDASISKMESDDLKKLNNDIKVDNSQENTFLQLSYLCQSYRDLNQTNSTSNPNNSFTIIDTVLKVLNDHDLQFKEIIESNDVQNDSFGVVVSMTNGLIINISNSIHKSMGYSKEMWKDRAFIDFIHPTDRITFVNYMMSILIDPCTISRGDGVSTVTYLRPKANDGFYCNMGYSKSENENYFQVCKLTITIKDLSYVSTTTSLAQKAQPQLVLVVKAQIIHSAYTCSEEKIENPIQFITKHNALFEWCYVDKFITPYFGYLPQNIIGRSIFDYYCIEDLTTIKEIHAKLIKSKSISLKGNPYRFKCQNGDFAVVETEWSNFVNPWSDQVEFVIGKHKIIRGPINPDVTTLADNTITKDIETKDDYGFDETPKDFEKITNENKVVAEVSCETNQTMDTNSKQQISMEYKDFTPCINCFVHPPVQVPLNVEVPPEMSSNYSDNESTHLFQNTNYESKSSSDTLLSYTELNYNDNIQRFFNSNLKTHSSEESSCSKTFVAREVTSYETDTNKVQPDTISSFQSGTQVSNTTIPQNSPSYDLEQNNASKNCQLTQKMLSRHNEKMVCDLVKQHKKNKSSKKQNLSNQAIHISDIAHGIKRNNSTINENNSCKLSKRKCLSNISSPTNVTQPLECQDIATTPIVTRATQIWSFCQITRDSQTMTDLPPRQPLPSSCQKLVLPSQALIVPCQPLIYNVPLSNNVMPVQPTCNLMDEKFGNIQGTVSDKLQSLNMPHHITGNSQLLRAQQQLHIKQLYQNIESKTEDQIISKKNDQNIQKKTRATQVNQEEIITGSDSDCKKETGSLKSSSGWLYEESSYYSSSLRDKTDSSEREDFPLLNVLEKTNSSHQLIKKQPFWMEDIVTTPDLVYRYQMDYGDKNEVLRKDINTLNTFTQPLLVSEQLKQLCVEIDVNGSSKTSYFEDGTSSSSDEDDCYISIGKNKRRRIDFCRMAMIYEENALIPPPTSPRNKMSKNDHLSS